MNELALSITGLTENGIPSGSSTASGRARNITITNIGTIAAQNVTYTASSLPSGTSINPTSCGTIAPLGTCVLTITPGTMPSATAGDTNPTPILLSIAGNNTDTLQTAIEIITYGSVYQGGYVFALDDTKGCSSMECTGSVGGKVVSLEDQKIAFLDGIAWDADPACDVPPNFLCTNQTDAWDFQYGQNLATVPGSTNPNYSGNTWQIASVLNGQDGNSNTPATYAAGVCISYRDAKNYDNWYLPALCDMGLGTNCLSGGQQNMEENLNGLIGTSCAFGHCLISQYWSSTELQSNPKKFAWLQFFETSSKVQAYEGKAVALGVRCVRDF